MEYRKVYVFHVDDLTDITGLKRAGEILSVGLYQIVFKRLEEIGLAYDYFYEESKSILVVWGKDTKKSNILKEKYTLILKLKWLPLLGNSHRWLRGREEMGREKINVWLEVIEALAEDVEYVLSQLLLVYNVPYNRNGL